MTSHTETTPVHEQVLPCTLERMVAEWDGSYPGTSLYQLVRRSYWKTDAIEHGRKGDLAHATFQGESTEGAVVEFRTSRWLNNEVGSELHSNPQLRITFKQGGSNGMPKTILNARDTEAEGGSSFAVFADYGEDDNRFRVFSLQLMGAHDYLAAQKKRAIQHGHYAADALIGMRNGHIWLSRIALGLAVDWEAYTLPAQLPPIEETSRRFAVHMDRNRHYWAFHDGL